MLTDLRAFSRDCNPHNRTRALENLPHKGRRKWGLLVQIILTKKKKKKPIFLSFPLYKKSCFCKMPNSPLRSSSEQTLIKESPSRFQNRYTERFKSVLESPPRENTSSSFTAKSSPLRSATPGSQHKIFDNGKYTSFEIPNEDRGEWRELSVKDEVDLINVSASPVRQESFSPKPSHEKKSSATPPQEQQQQQYHVSRPHRVPHYMQATKSFYDKVNNKKEDRRTDNILRPRFKGGITVSQ